MPRLRNVPGARDVISESRFCVAQPETYKGRWDELFNNTRPIRLEIGMGKGRFLMRNAALNRDVNYIGVEMFSSVLVRAVQRAEQLPDEETENIRFIRMDAKDLPDVFKKGEIETIYLNFSDPWPKERHAKRRLTSRGFLEIYEQILKDGSCVEFKTDNTDLFAFSVEEAKEAGWIPEVCTRDLYGDSRLILGNVPTEYEEKFVQNGKKICKMVIRKG